MCSHTEVQSHIRTALDRFRTQLSAELANQNEAAADAAHTAHAALARVSAVRGELTKLSSSANSDVIRRMAQREAQRALAELQSLVFAGNRFVVC